MKRLSLYLFLILFTFQTLSHADDIRGFQIDGISLGDSLLDHFSKSQINNAEKVYFPNSKKFFRIALKSRTATYDWLGFYLKKNDSSFQIYSLEGLKYIRYSDCKKKSKSIKKELDKIFDKKFLVTTKEEPHNYDKSKKSMIFVIDFNTTQEENYTVSRISCTDWSKKIEKEGFYDNLAIYLNTKVYFNFVKYEAYN